MLQCNDNFVVSRLTDGRCRTQDAHHSPTTNSTEPFGGGKTHAGNPDDEDGCNCPVKIGWNAGDPLRRKAHGGVDSLDGGIDVVNDTSSCIDDFRDCPDGGIEDTSSSVSVCDFSDVVVFPSSVVEVDVVLVVDGGRVGGHDEVKKNKETMFTVEVASNKWGVKAAFE